MKCEEQIEEQVYNSLIDDINIYKEMLHHMTCKEGDKLCDVTLLAIEKAYQRDHITEEQTRYLTYKILDDR